MLEEPMPEKTKNKVAENQRDPMLILGVGVALVFSLAILFLEMVRTGWL